MKTFALIAAFLPLIAAGPFEQVYEACKYPCFPLLVSVGSCIEKLPSPYSLTYTPSENTATWTGDIPKLVECFCGEQAQNASVSCTACVNDFGCAEPLDYGKVCSDPQYIPQYLQSVHSGVQCANIKSRRGGWTRRG